MNEHDATELERASVVERQLEIIVIQTRAKVDWLNDVKAMPQIKRAELDAEYAELDLKKHRLEQKLLILRSAVRTARAISKNAILVKLLKEAGLQHFIDKADRLSNEP